MCARNCWQSKEWRVKDYKTSLKCCFMHSKKKVLINLQKGVKIYLFIFQAQSRREWGEEDRRCVGWWNDSHPDRTAELHSPRGVCDAAWWYSVWGQSWGGAPHQEHRRARFTESRMEWQGWSLPGWLQHRYLVIMVDEDFLLSFFCYCQP